MDYKSTKMQYNTQYRQLILPEYGRNIQQMVDFCVTIENRDERTRCAYAIVKIMSNLFSEIDDLDEKERKLWDHINIMADFKLDIDFPHDVLKKENYNPKPQQVPYGVSNIKYRHYGQNIQLMINKVSELEDGEDKDALISMIAHHMKKLMLIHNKEGVDDAKILRDLAEYSNGRINLDPQKYILHEFKEVPVQNTSKNSKKKKNNSKK